MTIPTITSPEKGVFKTIATGLANNPAYLTLFALGLVGGQVAAIALWQGDSAATKFAAAVSWVVFLLASLGVVAFVEKCHAKASGISTMFLDEVAQSNFLESKTARAIAGRWSVKWYDGFGADRKPYEPDPEEIADIRTSGPAVEIHSYDPSHESEYWLFGRMSIQSDVPLIYWSKQGAQARLTGVAFLEVDPFDDEPKTMHGTWHGRTRDTTITGGDLEFVRGMG